MNKHLTSSLKEVRCQVSLGIPSPACSILENIDEGVLTLDMNKKIISFNPGAEVITGFNRQEAIGEHCFDIFRANICENNCVMDRSIADGTPQQNVPAYIINRAGDRFPISVSTIPLKDEQGKPFGIIEIIRDLSELEQLRRQIAGTFIPDDIVGKHPSIRQIFSHLPDIADSNSSVLIEGPTGSGKELFARAIHHLSPRQKDPFISINCGALPDTLLESELFGYTKGAFTGATRNKAGRFLLADGGTLFLDEICNTSETFQNNLLRVLEEGEFMPLGDTKYLKTDFRLISATNKDLDAMIREGVFRQDLYYRLNVIKIKLPPLTERREDIPYLVAHMIQKYNILKGKVISGVSDEVLSLFMDYPFPGNIRELENVIEYAYVFCKDKQIKLEHLPGDFGYWLKTASRSQSMPGTLASEEAERIHLTLKRHGGNRLATAQELGISRSTLWRKTKKYGLL